MVLRKAWKKVFELFFVPPLRYFCSLYCEAARKERGEEGGARVRVPVCAERGCERVR